MKLPYPPENRWLEDDPASFWDGKKIRGELLNFRWVIISLNQTVSIIYEFPECILTWNRVS